MYIHTCVLHDSHTLQPIGLSQEPVRHFFNALNKAKEAKVAKEALKEAKEAEEAKEESWKRLGRGLEEVFCWPY